jgi:hypothetical protein
MMMRPTRGTPPCHYTRASVARIRVVCVLVCMTTREPLGTSSLMMQ